MNYDPITRDTFQRNGILGMFVRIQPDENRLIIHVRDFGQEHDPKLHNAISELKQATGIPVEYDFLPGHDINS